MAEHRDKRPLEPGDSFDYRNAALRPDQWTGWSRLRDQCPTRVNAYAAESSTWFLLAYEDVREAFKDPRTFSSGPPVVPESRCPSATRPWEPLQITPPLGQAEMRTLLLPFFSASAISAKTELIRAACRTSVENLHTRGKVEFIGDFARMVYTQAFLATMGLDPSQADCIIHRANVLLHTSIDKDPDFAIRIRAKSELFSIIDKQLGDYSNSTTDGPLARIASYTSLSGQRILRSEAVTLIFMLYANGFDSTVATLAYVFQQLAQDRSTQRRIADGALHSQDVAEELLRVRAAVNESRYVTRDIEFAGRSMKKGDRIVLVAAAANSDPFEFEAPEEIRYGRRPNRHLTFGAGPNHCLGAQLARSVIEISLDEWHRVIAGYWISDQTSIEDQPGFVSTLTSLPLAWAC